MRTLSGQAIPCVGGARLRSSWPRRTLPAAFTLIESPVVIVIMDILTAMLLSALTKAN